MHHQLRHCWRLHLSFGSRQATCTQRVCPLTKPPFCSSSIYFGGNTHLRPERERGGRQPGMCKHLLAYTAWASAAPKRHQMLPLIVKMIEMRLPLLLLLERSWNALGWLLARKVLEFSWPYAEWQLQLDTASPLPRSV